MEGAGLQLTGCSIHDCARHGVAVFGALDGQPGSCSISNCDISHNKLNGVLVRSGAAPSLQHNHIHDNAEYGIMMQVRNAEQVSEISVGQTSS